MTVLLVFVGGAVGAPLRYVVDRFVQRRHDMVFPWGTFTVNVIGSVILGALMATAPSGQIAALVGTGFCGGLTTFSTLGFETLRLVEEGSLLEAALNVAGSLLVGVLAATGGYLLFG